MTLKGEDNMKNVKEYEIKIEGKEWEKALDDAFKAKQKDLKVEGFRKGKCPKDIYIKKFGVESLYMDAVDAAANTAFKQVLTDNDVHPVCQPQMDVTDINDQGVAFKFTIIEKPTVKLGEYKKLKVEKEEASVSAEEIEAEITALRDKYADTVEDNEATVENGYTAVIDFEGKVDGKILEGGTGANYPLQIGSNTFIPGFEDGLLGMKIGEEKELKLTFPKDYTDALKGKKVVFAVKIVGIKKRVLPELGPDFYQDLGMEDIKTEKEFEKAISKTLLDKKQAEADNKYIDALLKKACENMEVEINEEIIADEVERILNQYKQQLQMQGLSLEQYLEFTKGSVEDLKKMMTPEAEGRIKARYLLEAIAEKEKVEVSEEDVKAELEKIAQMYATTVEEVTNMLGDKEVIQDDLKMRKALDILKGN